MQTAHPEDSRSLERFIQAQQRDYDQALDALYGGVPDEATLALLQPPR